MSTPDNADQPDANADLADLKAKMREALDRKNAKARGVREDAPVHEKAHGSEVHGGAGPKLHRRKAGGGGS
jgi:hypothetical protein